MTSAILVALGAVLAIAIPTVTAYLKGIARGRELERREQAETAGTPW